MGGMVIRLMLTWWYGPGFLWVWRGQLASKLHHVSEIFSVPDMLKTLFAPFRQTYVGKAHGVSALQAFADRTFSRAIGFVIRSLLLFVAFLAALLVTVFGLFLCIVWPVLPLLPVAAVVLAVMEVGL